MIERRPEARPDRLEHPCPVAKGWQDDQRQFGGRSGLSASPCLQRVKRLESAGYITGYGAQINLAKLTESITVFTEVTLVDHRREDFVKFEANMRNVEELMECHLISGGYDYLLRFVCRNINHYQERMENLLERNVGIEKYFSYIVLKSPIVKHVLPLKTLLDPPE